MEAAQAASGRRRLNSRSLRPLGPLKVRRSSTDRAFESFYKEHVGAVYQYALAVLTNPADAEDVTQQTFLNAYRAFQRGERPHKPHNWVIKIAHNVCRMRWRQAARRPQEVPLEQVREPVTLDEDKPSVTDVLRALSHLPFNQRAVLVMREVEGRSYNEISEILGVTVPAVEALLFRARRKLQARRKALGVLTAVPLPPSLASFFGGGGLLAAGGAVVSSELVLKAAAVVATGIVLGGAGYESVKAVAADGQTEAAAALSPSSVKWVSPAERFTAAARQHRLATAAFAHPGRAGHGSPALRRRDPGEKGPLLAPGGSTPGNASRGPAPTVAERAVGTVPVQVPVPSAPALPSAPAIPSAPAVPKPPVNVPVPPPPALPPLPTVSVPTLPLPPPPPILK